MTAKTAEAFAHEFLEQYSLTHEYFRSEEVCDAYKKAGLPEPEGGKGWRDKWGGVMTRAAKAGLIKKVGKATPMSGSTHMASTVLWMSMKFKGERTAIQTGADQIELLRMKWVMRQITDLRELLWAAYEFGFDQGASGKKKMEK